MSAAGPAGAEALAALRAADQELAQLGPWPHALPLGRLGPALAGVLAALPRADWIVAGPRHRVALVLRGCPVARLVDPRSGARPWKLAPSTGRADARALQAVGLALGSGGPTCCLLGSAALAAGPTWEAFNLAALTGAPVLFVHLDAALPPDAPVSGQLAGRPVDLARAAGLAVSELALPGDEGEQVGAAEAAVRAARQGPLPAFLSLTT